jgi:hypothetical protein
MITVAVTGDAPQAAAAGAPITLALITSQTGPAAAEFSQAPAGFLARIALQNAKGGVNGHKIVPLVINDETSPTQVVTAVQNAISKGAFGIVSDSPLFFEAAKYPQQQGMPVTGGYFDGPEWGEQPYTNMFASDNGSVDPKYPANPGVGNFVRSHGGTNLGVYGYGISPSSSIEANSAALGFKHIGGKVSVVDTSIPFGGVDFTTEALVAKQKGINSIYPTMDVNSNLALVTSLEQAGVHPKGGLAHRLRPDGGHVLRVELRSGRLLPVRVPALLAAQLGDAPDGGRIAEVPALQTIAVPQLLAIRVVGRSRPDDQGTAVGGQEPDPCQCDQRPSPREVLQCQRAPAQHDQLLDDLRPQPRAHLRVLHGGQDQGLRARFDPTDLWQ